jgi:hypothetical protein
LPTSGRFASSKGESPFHFTLHPLIKDVGRDEIRGELDAAGVEPEHDAPMVVPVASAWRTIMSSSFSSPSVATAMSSGPCYLTVVRARYGPDVAAYHIGRDNGKPISGPHKRPEMR